MKLFRMVICGLGFLLSVEAGEGKLRLPENRPASGADWARLVEDARSAASRNAARERMRLAAPQTQAATGVGGIGYDYTTAGAQLGGRGPVGSPVTSSGGYLGGNALDSVEAMVSDGDGNLIVAGRTLSTDFKASSGAVAQSQGDVYVQKLKGDGSAVLWTAMLGGSGAETVAALAVDKTGAVYVAGSTNSTDMTATPGACQTQNRGGYDGFVAKLAKDGSALIYLTYLGGSDDETLKGLAVDSTGIAAVTGYSGSVDFPAATGSLRSAFGTGPGALLARLDATGKVLLSSTVLGGSSGLTEGDAVAFHPDGTLIAAGTTTAPDMLPGTGFQRYSQSAGLWRSGSGAGTPGAASEGMRGTLVNWIAIDPQHPQVLYAATLKGVYKSTDGAESWRPSNAGLNSATILSVAVNPISTSVVYAATGGGLFKSVDGGSNWNSVSSGPGKSPAFVAIDPQTPATIYVVTDNQGLVKSTDAGFSWNDINGGFAYPFVTSVAVDPKTPTTLMAGSFGGVYRSLDGGQSWSVSLSMPDDLAMRVAIDPKNPSQIYASFLFSECYRSSDAGASWQRMTDGLPATLSVWAFAPHPKTQGLVYAATSDGVYRSTNDGRQWSRVGDRQAGLQQFCVAADPQNSDLVYSGGELWEEGFLLRLGKDGQTLQYSTYFGGDTRDRVTALAVDSNGDYYVAGSSDASDFPTTAGAVQRTPGGSDDAFLLRISSSSGALAYATLLGGDGSDTPAALTIGSDGLAVMAGVTTSTNFPLTAGTTGSPLGGPSDAFVAKFSSAGPAFVLSTLFGGSGADAAHAVVAASSGLMLAGTTTSTDLPGGLAGLSKSYRGGSEDGFLSRINSLAGAAALDPAKLSFAVNLEEISAPLEQTITVTSSAGALAWSFQVPSSAPWLSVRQDAANVARIIVRVDATGLNAGTYQSAFSASALLAGVGPITVPVTLEVNSTTPPVLADAAVLNGADLQIGAISPGLVIRVLGSGLGPGTRVVADTASGVLPTTLAGVRVLINDTAAPIEWVESGAISAIVPYAVAGAGQATVVVERSGLRSGTATLNVLPTAPALFTADGSGTGQLEATNEDYTVNGVGNPAVRGRPVILHGTGEGVTDPAGRDGLLALETLPAALAKIEVLIGGLSCDLYYAGAAPGRPAGYIELNLKVPEEAPAGDAVPVILRIGGRESWTLTTLALR